MKYKCPCCGYYTLDSVGEYDICKVCFWEDDPFQREDEAEEEGANHLSLIEARKQYAQFGACSHAYVKYVRKPTKEEEHGEKKSPSV